jgi:hypothetical protein
MLSYLTTRYFRCATPGASTTRICSSTRSGPMPSNRRAPTEQERHDVQLQLVDVPRR